MLNTLKTQALGISDWVPKLSGDVTILTSIPHPYNGDNNTTFLPVGVMKIKSLIVCEALKYSGDECHRKAH